MSTDGFKNIKGPSCKPEGYDADKFPLGDPKSMDEPGETIAQSPPLEPKRPNQLTLVSDILEAAHAIEALITDRFAIDMAHKGRGPLLGYIETHFEAGLRAVKALREEMER